VIIKKDLPGWSHANTQRSCRLGATQLSPKRPELSARIRNVDMIILFHSPVRASISVLPVIKKELSYLQSKMVKDVLLRLPHRQFVFTLPWRIGGNYPDI